MDQVNYFCKIFVPLKGGLFMLKKLPVFIFIVFEKPGIVRRHICRRIGDPD